MNAHEREYYAMLGDERRGPFTLDQLLAAGVSAETFVWYEGSRRWLPAAEVREIASRLNEAPLEAPPSPIVVDDDGLRVYPESYLDTPYTVGMYCWFIAVGWAVFFLVQVGTLGPKIANVGIVGGAILWAIAIGFFFTFWYRALNLVQDGYAWLVPGAAVGYLFIPIFNCYWMFRATVGTVRELNRYAERHGLAAPRPSMFLAVAVAVYFAASAIPVLGIVGTLLNLVLFPLFLSSIKKTALCFCSGRRRQAPEAARGNPSQSDRGAIAAAVLAAIVLPVSLLMCAVGCLIPWRHWVVPADKPEHVFAAVGIAVFGGLLGLFGIWLIDPARTTPAAKADDTPSDDRYVLDDD